MRAPPGWAASCLPARPAGAFEGEAAAGEGTRSVAVSAEVGRGLARALSLHLTLCPPAASALPSIPPTADAPPITFCIVQKRHHTRLFPQPQDQQNRDRSGNVMPGG